MGAHALLSASSAARWLACTPSARMEAGLKDTTSPYAEEGTRAHALAELTLDGYLQGGSDQVADTDDREMQEAVQRYVDIVVEKMNEARAASPDAELHIEHRLDFSPWVPEGFGTGDAVLVSDKYIEIVDLKYGKGVPVSAVNNPQMRLYALGAHHAMGLLYGYDTVRMTIVQPRLDSVSTDELPLARLLDWGDSIRPIARNAFDGKGTPMAGGHCRFCKARATCRALADYMTESIRDDFAPGPELEDWEVADIVRKAKDIISWLKDVDQYALDRALQGTVWPGLKVVEGRSKRVITDSGAAAVLLQNGGYQDIWKPQELKTLTDLEKLCGKKRLTAILQDVIDKPQGKPTLVDESDKREPMALQTVAEDFDDNLISEFVQKKGD